MKSQDTLEVTIAKLPASDKEVFWGPETVDGVTYVILNEDITSIVSSIKTDSLAVEIIATNLVENIKAALGERPRPAIDSRVGESLRKHTSDHKWRSFDYSGPRVTEMVRWHIAHESGRLDQLIKDGRLNLKFQ